MPATLQKLIKRARSQLAEELRCYYRRLIHSLDRTPWYRKGQPIPASAVAIPIRVLKEETRQPERWRDRGDDGEDEARSEPARRYIDPELAALYEEPTFVKRREEVAWEDEQPNIKRAAGLGAPGGGKSFLTLTTAMELAWEARRALAAWRQPLEALYLPISLRLVDLARPDLPWDPAEAVMQLLRDQYQPYYYCRLLPLVGVGNKRHGSGCTASYPCPACARAGQWADGGHTAPGMAQPAPA